MTAKAGRSPLVVAAVILAACRLAAAAPLALHIHSEHAMFQVLISPGTVGTNDFVLQLMSGEGNPLPVKEATLVLSLPGRGTEFSASHQRGPVRSGRQRHASNLGILYRP